MLKKMDHLYGEHTWLNAKMRQLHLLAIEDMEMMVKEASFTVDLAQNGNDGLHTALEGEYDLVILDVMLPGLDGWDVLRSLRRQGRNVPVLFLTAKDQVEDRIKG